MIYTPYEYQNKITQAMLDNPKLLAVVDMGLGKTVCTLTAVERLMYDSFDINKVLVIAPKRVVENTWTEELAKWDHLKNLTYQLIMDKDPTKREEEILSNADITLINREKLPWLIDTLRKRKLKWKWDCLVVDESSMFKCHSTKGFKLLATVAHIVKRVYELTGTPTPNGVHDIWSQMYLLDKGERLGKNITAFRNNYMIRGKTQYTDWGWRPQLGAEKEIWNKVSELSIAMKAEDYLELPPRIDRVLSLELNNLELKRYKTLEREQILKIKNDMQDTNNIVAINKAVAINKLIQFTSGAIYDENKQVVSVNNIKIDALKEIVTANENKPIIVFYIYQHEKERLYRAFADLEPRELMTPKDVEDWNNGKIKMLLLHPQSAGHGLNLQAGGNIIVWHSLPWSLEQYQQANARLHRQGQKKAVIIHHLCIKNTIDTDIMLSLGAKELNQDLLIKKIIDRNL